MKQVKLITANDNEELEYKLNEFYNQCFQQNRKIIKTQMLSNKSPLTVQVIYEI